MKGNFIPVHPVEKTPYIFGAVHTYEAAEKYSPLQETVLRDHLKFMGVSQEMINDDINRRFGWRDTDGSRFFAGKDLTSGNWEKHADTTGLDKEQYRRWKGDGEMMKNEIRVHGEVEYQGRTLKMDATADDGQFRFKTPKLYGDYQMFLWASDYSKWPDDEKKFNDHIWSKKSEYSYPEFYVRLSNPYPKFAKPYNHYQTAHRPLKVKEEGKSRPSLEKTLQEVKVYASHGGLRRDKYMRPVVALDAIKAMYETVGDPRFSGKQMTKGVIVRHLILPGHIENSLKVLDWIGDTFAPGEVLVSLMRQYTPMPGLPAPLNRPVTDEEYDAVLSWMYLNDLEGFAQEEDAADTAYIPDF